MKPAKQDIKNSIKKKDAAGKDAAKDDAAGKDAAKDDAADRANDNKAFGKKIQEFFVGLIPTIYAEAVVISISCLRDVFKALFDVFNDINEKLKNLGSNGEKFKQLAKRLKQNNLDSLILNLTTSTKAYEDARANVARLETAINKCFEDNDLSDLVAYIEDLIRKGKKASEAFSGFYTEYTRLIDILNKEIPACKGDIIQAEEESKDAGGSAAKWGITAGFCSILLLVAAGGPFFFGFVALAKFGGICGAAGLGYAAAESGKTSYQYYEKSQSFDKRKTELDDAYKQLTERCDELHEKSQNTLASNFDLMADMTTLERVKETIDAYLSRRGGDLNHLDKDQMRMLMADILGDLVEIQRQEDEKAPEDKK